ncbi:hypothetical protein AYO21_08537 [Fonsecaea monophora]|uniref:Ig-like domain-containing protein n=1 Tax=Fonsecaea monophora TaxID=254056 RepID=A0A177EZ38_9EURO|nr:hypothetical protein AYO21_08537 [Fonsecaea monophora]KAH0844575.1 hypothetical protein FOPE_09623 [Fonsecaea pedrosoi]OAG37238.1 hypothetical protein AYO21_08537 [Fonsecaea monophora]
MLFVRSLCLLAIVAVRVSSAAQAWHAANGDQVVTVTHTNTHYVCPCETSTPVKNLNPVPTGGWADWAASASSSPLVRGTTSSRRTSTAGPWPGSVSSRTTKTTTVSSSGPGYTQTSSSTSSRTVGGTISFTSSSSTTPTASSTSSGTVGGTISFTSSSTTSASSSTSASTSTSSTEATTSLSSTESPATTSATTTSLSTTTISSTTADATSTTTSDTTSTTTSDTTSTTTATTTISTTTSDVTSTTTSTTTTPAITSTTTSETTSTTSTTTTTTSVNGCPTGTYVIQSSLDNNYATIGEYVGGQYLVVFNQPAIETAAEFSWVEDVDGTCMLGPTAVPGLSTYVLDQPGEFVTFHYLFLSNPTLAAATDLEPSEVACSVDSANELYCAVEDQDVLQLFNNVLTIAATDQGFGAATFTLVQTF